MDISLACRGAEFYPRLKEIGYSGIDMPSMEYTKRDLILSDTYDETVLGNFARLQEVGLRVCQMHLTDYSTNLPPLGDGSYQAYEDYMLPILQKEIILAGRMNCRTVVMHPYFEGSREKSQEGNIVLISKLLPILEENGVILSLENIYGFGYCDIHLSLAEDLLFYTDHFHSPYVGICLDTGHAIIRGQKPVEMLKKIGEQLTAVHLHTTVPNIDMHAIPYCVSYGEKIDWKAFVQQLRGIGYRGTFNMEVRPSFRLTNRAAESYYQLAYDVAKGILE